PGRRGRSRAHPRRVAANDSKGRECPAVAGSCQESPLRHLITGCAGFIGSNLADRLLAAGHEVVGYDDFSTGREEFLAAARASRGFRFIRGDVLDTASLAAALSGVDCVFHLAANADVRWGTAHPRKDLEQNTLGTHSVLEAMRRADVGRIVFA